MASLTQVIGCATPSTNHACAATAVKQGTFLFLFKKKFLNTFKKKKFFFFKFFFPIFYEQFL